MLAYVLVNNKYGNKSEIILTSKDKQPFTKIALLVFWYSEWWVQHNAYLPDLDPN